MWWLFAEVLNAYHSLLLSVECFNYLSFLYKKIPNLKMVWDFNPKRVQRLYYPISPNTVCGTALACDNIEVEDCVKIWCRVKFVDSAAKSTSLIRDSAS